MTSKVQIISQMAVALGDSPVTSLTEPRKAVEVGVELFDLAYETAMGDRTWSFQRKQVTLSQLAGDPLFRWKYRFQLPGDFREMKRTDPLVDYEIVGNELHCNVSAIMITYTGKADVEELPEWFAPVLVYQLALLSAKPLTGSDSLEDKMSKRLYGDPNRPNERGALAKALFIDSQNEPVARMVDEPFINCRYQRGRFL